MMQQGVGLDRLRKESARAWAIAWKDMRTYYLTPPSLMFGVLFPIALFFTFTVGRNLSSLQSLPILLSQTVFWASSTVGPVVIPLERRTKTFDRYLSTPVSLFSVLSDQPPGRHVATYRVTTWSARGTESTSAAGKWILNVDPCPFELSTVMVPPCL